MDTLHHDLEAIEAPGFSSLHLIGGVFNEVPIDNTVRSHKKSKDMGYKVAFVVIETVVPVMEVLGEVQLLSSPEGGFSLLVHLPYLVTH